MSRSECLIDSCDDLVLGFFSRGDMLDSVASAERVLRRAKDVPQQLGDGGRLVDVVPVPDDSPLQPQAPEAHQPGPHDVPPHRLRRLPPASSPLHLLQVKYSLVLLLNSLLSLFMVKLWLLSKF